MIRCLILALLTLSCAHAEVKKPPLKPNLDLEIQKGPGDKYYKSQINDEDYIQMYQKWFDTGVSTLFSAVANKNLKKQRRSVVRKFGHCSSQATDLSKHAQCVSKLLRNEIKEDAHAAPKKGVRLDRYRGRGSADDWTGGFKTATSTRQKRSAKVQQTDGYNLSSNKRVMTPLGSIAKMFMESVKQAKNKTDLPAWQDTVAKLKANGEKRKKFKKYVEDDSEEMSQMSMRGVKNKIQGKEEIDIDVDALIEDPEKLQAFLKERRKKKQKPEERIMDMIRQGMKLGYTIAGQNTTNFENRTLKIASPRFLGVTKEDISPDEINFISPSLFSLHDEGEGIENLTSLPNMLKSIGLKEDQQIWLDVIMEAAGVNEQSDKLDDEVKHIEFNHTKSLMTNISSFIGEDGTPMYATKDNVTELGGDVAHAELFEKLHSMYSKSQLREMNSTGYAILSPEQLHLLYGPGSPYADKDAHAKFMRLSEDQIHDRLLEDIHAMAEMDKFQLKQKDFVLSPVSFTPVIALPALASQAFILSPIIFSPLILSPAIYGAVVLSPWMFVPLVLSPRILGCLILSPFIFSPVILTPIALHPVILSPGIFNPLVLDPLLLVPFILSPQVFTPLILSPLCLVPIILNPLVGSPLVLSPFVLSPIIASPMLLGALVLSPYALSPVLFSPLIAFAAVLSPSWLS